MKASEFVQKDLNDGDIIVLESDIENVIKKIKELILKLEVKKSKITKE